MKCINIQPKNGFSLVEVVVAILIVGIILVAVFGTQSTMFYSTVRSMNKIKVTVAMKQFLHNIQLQHTLKAGSHYEEQMTHPTGQMTCSVTKTKHPNLDHLLLLHITATWEEFGRQKNAALSYYWHDQPSTSQGKTA